MLNARNESARSETSGEMPACPGLSLVNASEPACSCVVIVEDHDGIREAIETVLGLEGYRCYAVKNGREAVSVLKRLSAEQSSALVLLDLMMPIMNGWEFLQAQEAGETLGRHPTVVVTALGVSSALRNVPHTASTVGYLRKPIDLEQLLEIVQQYCVSQTPKNRPEAVPTSAPI